MQYTLNSDNTVTLVLDQGELFTINDALDVRVTLATFPKAPADRLPEPERRRAAALERTTYQAQCALEDQIESEQDEPGTNHVPARSELGEALFEMLSGINRAQAKVSELMNQGAPYEVPEHARCRLEDM